MTENKKTDQTLSQDMYPQAEDDFYSRMKTCFQKNLMTLMEENGLSTRDLAEKLDCSDKTIVSYMNQTSPKVADPKFLGRLKKAFDISLDDFLFREMSSIELFRENRRDRMRTTYAGLYMLYYLSTEPFKGSDDKEAPEALRYGIIYIYDNEYHKSDTNLKCEAGLGISDKEEAERLFRKCQRIIRREENEGEEKKEGRKTEDRISALLDEHSERNHYYGQLRIDQDHYYLNLMHIMEHVLMIGYSINSNVHEYIGGLVTVNSISRGREKAPVMQLAGLSRYFLDCNEEELDNALHMHYRIELEEEVADRILDFITSLDDDSLRPKEHMLNAEQKKALVTAEIEYEVRKIIEKKVYRHFKMTSRDDDLFYHYLKTRRNGPAGDNYGKGKI